MSSDSVFLSILISRCFPSVHIPSCFPSNSTARSWSSLNWNALCHIPARRAQPNCHFHRGTFFDPTIYSVSPFHPIMQTYNLPIPLSYLTVQNVSLFEINILNCSLFFFYFCMSSLRVGTFFPTGISPVPRTSICWIMDVNNHSCHLDNLCQLKIRKYLKLLFCS